MMQCRSISQHSFLLPIMVAFSLTAVGSGESSARLLVIMDAQDDAGVFREQSLSEQGRRALVWPEGVLIVPDTLPWLDDGSTGLAFELQEITLIGVGHGGRFRLLPGRYDLDTPLVITDGELVLSLFSGYLEIGADRIIYYRPRPAPEKHARNRRGEYYVLAGLLLATALLLRAARRRSGRP